jgi:hypothetical protein
MEPKIESECYICGGWQPINHVYFYKGKEFTETLHLDKRGRHVREICGIGGNYPDVVEGFDEQLAMRKRYWQTHDFIEELNDEWK